MMMLVWDLEELITQMVQSVHIGMYATDAKNPFLFLEDSIE